MEVFTCQPPLLLLAPLNVLRAGVTVGTARSLKGGRSARVALPTSRAPPQKKARQDDAYDCCQA